MGGILARIRVNLGCHKTTSFENQPRKGEEEEAAQESRDEINDEKLVKKGIWLIANK